MTTPPPPKPGPAITPIHAVPPRGAGVNRDDVESRSRIVAMLLPYLKDPEALIEVADWILLGPDDEEAES